MKKLSRANVAYDLTISPHTERVSYGETEMVYVFSSKLYREKFKSRYLEHRESKCLELKRKLGINVKLREVADIMLYASIEKRGFLVWKGTEAIKCVDDITLDGVIVTTNS